MSHEITNRNKLIGENIARMRKRTGLNQFDMARELDLSRTSISNIEQGRHGISIDTLYTLCVYLNCQVTDILPPVTLKEIPDDWQKLLSTLPKEKYDRAYGSLRIIFNTEINPLIEV